LAPGWPFLGDIECYHDASMGTYAEIHIGENSAAIVLRESRRIRAWLERFEAWAEERER
jgi:hypothetical protein